MDDVSRFIDRAKAQSAYSVDADTFLNEVLALARDTKKYLAGIRKEFKHKPEAFAQQAKDLCDAWLLLHDVTKPVVDAHALSTPYPLVQLLNFHLSTFPEMKDTRIVIGCVPQLNYYQHSDKNLQVLLRRLRAVIKSRRKPQANRIAFLSLPYSRSRSLFANCLLYHELGHFLFQSLSSGRVSFRDKARKLLEPRVAEFFRAKIRGFGEEECQWLAQKLVPWFEELFADIFSVKLLGPAFTFVAAELIQLLTRPDPTMVRRCEESHPCAAFRFREQLRALYDGGWRDAELENPVLGYVKELAEWGLKDYVKPEGMDTQVWEKLWKPLAFIFDSSTDDVHDLVNSVIKKGHENPHSLCERDQENVVACLEHAIVPSVLAGSESGARPRALHPVAIINGGVLFWLTGMVPLYKLVEGYNDKKIEGRARLEERVEMWVGKALEDWLLLKDRPAKEMVLPGQ